METPLAKVETKPTRHAKHIDLFAEHAKEKLNLPSDWRIFRWECFPKSGRDETLYYAVTGAVCEYQYLKGKRKGQTNWNKRNVSTEVMVNLPVSEHTEWKTKWELRTGMCSECTGTGEIMQSWSVNDGTKYRICHRCNGTGRLSQRNESTTA